MAAQHPGEALIVELAELLHADLPRDRMYARFLSDAGPAGYTIDQSDTTETFLDRMTLKTAADHITVSPGIRGGKPHVTGRRITVADIVVWHEWLGRDADEIATEYDLSLAAIYAALAFNYDNRALVVTSLEDGRALAERLRRQIPSKLPPAP